MLRSPLFELNIKPEGINSERDNRKQPPFNPVAEKLNSCPIKTKSSSVNNGVLDLPSIKDNMRPRIANTNCYKCYDTP